MLPASVSQYRLIYLGVAFFGKIVLAQSTDVSGPLRDENQAPVSIVVVVVVVVAAITCCNRPFYAGSFFAGSQVGPCLHGYLDTTLAMVPRTECVFGQTAGTSLRISSTTSRWMWVFLHHLGLDEVAESVGGNLCWRVTTIIPMLTASEWMAYKVGAEHVLLLTIVPYPLCRFEYERVVDDQRRDIKLLQTNPNAHMQWPPTRMYSQRVQRFSMLWSPAMSTHDFIHIFELDMEMPGKIVQPHSTGLTGTRRMSEWVHADLVCTPSRMESTAVVAISETWNVLCQNTQQFSVEGFCILIWSPNSTELRTVVQVCGREGEKSRACW